MGRSVGAAIALTLAAAPVARALIPPPSPEPPPARRAPGPAPMQGDLEGLRDRVGGRPTGPAACRRGVSKP